MEIETYKLEGKKSGTASLNDSIFNLDPDMSIISTLVQWTESNQKPLRARTKNRSEVKGTTQKYGRQKGGGGARHGSKKANIFYGSGFGGNKVIIIPDENMVIVGRWFGSQTESTFIKMILDSK